MQMTSGVRVWGFFVHYKKEITNDDIQLRIKEIFERINWSTITIH